MSVETRQVLEMLKDGKITAEDAEKLIEKLTGVASGSPGAAPGGASSATQPGATPSSVPSRPRFLRIRVERPGRENVNMRVPLSLARAGIGWMSVIPPRVSERLAEQGIDLTALGDLKGEDIREALENLNIDIDKGDGKTVRIYCE